MLFRNKEIVDAVRYKKGMEDGIDKQYPPSDDLPFIYTIYGKIYIYEGTEWICTYNGGKNKFVLSDKEFHDRYEPVPDGGIYG